MLFDTEEKCYKYENPDLNYVTMWNGEGKPTTSAIAAKAVYISNEAGAEAFIAKCQFEKTISTGITKRSYGLYVWSTWDAKYIHLPFAVINSLYHPITMYNSL